MTTTEQERFWAGTFGDDYSDRNAGGDLLAEKWELLTRALSHTEGISTAIEFGCNVGLNLRALRYLWPGLSCSGVEINERAAEQAKATGAIIHHGSLLDMDLAGAYDLVLAAGVLIHIAPADLHRAYERIHAACGRYICLIEYYSPESVEMDYRGHRGRLYKRDFAADLLDAYPDLRLADYGFIYHGDPASHQSSDQVWFLLERY